MSGKHLLSILDLLQDPLACLLNHVMFGDDAIVQLLNQMLRTILQFELNLHDG